MHINNCMSYTYTTFAFLQFSFKKHLHNIKKSLLLPSRFKAASTSFKMVLKKSGLGCENMAADDRTKKHY